jgi:DNA invertase Pin-like site-specific DNA recombinase
MTTRRQPAGTPPLTTAGLEQDFNSLDAQREACEQYIRSQASLGWQLIPEPYDDGGFSGANIERPAFARLMQDVEASKIDVVVVYKVDRLSRSLLDFAKVMDRFNRAGAAFVSITQNFSTADAIGRLTLNMLMSFAEFEREMIAERTRDKMSAARRKGKWTGGPPPLGYDVVDHKLVVNQAEAALVRRLYDLYLDLRSALAVAGALNAESRTTKHHVSTSGRSHGAREWDRNSVLHVLRNPIPAGLMACHGEVHEGQHQAIIDRVTYQRVQNLLDERVGQRNRWGRNPDYLLTGSIYCALCGQPYSPASTRKGNREHRYYRCSKRNKGGLDGCQAAPLPARAIEEFVVERVRAALADGRLAADVTQAVKERLAGQRAGLVAERKELPGKIAALSSDGQRVVELAGNLTGAGRRLLDTKLQDVGDQLGRLEARLRDVERRLCLLDDCEVEAEWVSQCLADFNQVWDTLNPANRGRLVRAVVERVEVDEPNSDVRVFIANLNSSPAAVRAIAVNS